MFYYWPVVNLLLLLFPLQSALPAMPGSISKINPYSRIDAIPLPAGYRRQPVAAHSFAAWLRAMPLKPDKTVYLYNGRLKANQHAQFAVLDISTGDKDLQQCADAIMRLRAEYLYSEQQLTAIDFMDNNQHHYRLPPAANRAIFNQYLSQVFSYCGTASLEKQLLPVGSMQQVAAGDVLIKGGFPGHAMLVADVASNARGQMIYLLVQGFMPAQDMHIVVNPLQPSISPWYTCGEGVIETPEWRFNSRQLRTWPAH
ncbi:MAG TPA: DUF4846 domain-containing protein [Chitinophagaceae bacterium]|nr:DUF4846 domain-containing protein [Chitinophagaceae bacterium]